MPKLKEEQLRFFYHEVLGLFDWSDDEEAEGIDPLEFVRQQVAELRKKAQKSTPKQNITNIEVDMMMPGPRMDHLVHTLLMKDGYVREYSAYVEQAMRVTEKIAEPFAWHIETVNLNDNTTVWDVVVWGDVDGDTIAVRASAPTLAHAICRTALKYVIAMREIKENNSGSKS